jgi:hypothetical protein
VKSIKGNFRVSHEELVNRRSLRVMANNAIVDAITVEAIGVLREAGVDCILLKGPSFARWLYPSQFVRPYVDTDLLVPIHSLERVDRALSGVGFSSSKPSVDLRYDRPTYVIDWKRPRDAAVIEIHQTLVGVRAPLDQVWTTLWRRTETMSLQGMEVRILDESARCLHVALHAAQDGGRVGQAVEDLKRAAMLAPLDKWRAAAGLSASLDATDAFTYGLKLVPRGAEIATSLDLPVVTSVDVVLHAENRGAAARSIDWWLRVPSVRERTRLAIAKAFPPPSFMRTWAALARKGKIGLVLAYPWRLGWLVAQGVIGIIMWTAVRLRQRAS